MDNESERKRVALAEELYLLYFNRTLLNQGIISEMDYRLMDAKIRSRASSKTSSKNLTHAEHELA